MIIPPAFDDYHKSESLKDGVLVEPDFTYSSENNNQWMTAQELIIKIKELYPNQ